MTTCAIRHPDLYNAEMSQSLSKATVYALKIRTSIEAIHYIVLFVMILEKHIKKFPIEKCLACCSIAECSPWKHERTLSEKHIPRVISILNKDHGGIFGFFCRAFVLKLSTLQSAFADRAMYLDMFCDTDKDIVEMCTNAAFVSIPDEKESSWTM